MKLSAVILTWNEEKYIERCLESLEGICNDAIIVDSFSTDRTAEIASQYGTVITREYTNTRDQRNFGLSLCSNKWRFLIDADEWISKQLWLQIDDLLSTAEDQKADCVWLPRHNYVNNIQIGGPEMTIHLVKEGIIHGGHPLHADRAANAGPNLRLPGFGHVMHSKTGLEWMQAARMYWWMCPETFAQVGPPPGVEDLLGQTRPFKLERHTIDVWNEYIKTPVYRKLTEDDIKSLVIDEKGWHKK